MRTTTTNITSPHIIHASYIYPPNVSSSSPLPRQSTSTNPYPKPPHQTKNPSPNSPHSLQSTRACKRIASCNRFDSIIVVFAAKKIEDRSDETE